MEKTIYIIGLINALIMVLLVFYRYLRKKEMNNILQGLSQFNQYQNAMAYRDRQEGKKTFRTFMQGWLEESRSGMTLKDLGVISVGSILGVYFLANAIFHSVLIAMVLSIFGLTIPKIMLDRRKKENMEEFDKNLSKALRRIANNLRAGYTIMMSIKDLKDSQDSHELIKYEFGLVYKDLSYNISITDALMRMYKRTKSNEVQLLAIAVSNSMEMGGNLTEVLVRIAETIDERQRQKQRYLAITASQRSQKNILTIVPPGFVVLLILYKPETYKAFFNSVMGITITIIMIGLIIIGNILIGKLIDE